MIIHIEVPLLQSRYIHTQHGTDIVCCKTVSLETAVIDDHHIISSSAPYQVNVNQAQCELESSHAPSCSRPGKHSATL